MLAGKTLALQAQKQTGWYSHLLLNLQDSSNDLEFVVAVCKFNLNLSSLNNSQSGDIVMTNLMVKG